MKLPKWFLDLSVDHVKATLALILDADVAFGLDESWLNGERHPDLTDEALDLAKTVSGLPVLGRYPRDREFRLYGSPFKSRQVAQFLEQYDIARYVLHYTVREDYIRFLFNKDVEVLDWLKRTLSLGLWAESEV